MKGEEGKEREEEKKRSTRVWRATLEYSNEKKKKKKSKASQKKGEGEKKNNKKKRKTLKERKLALGTTPWIRIFAS